MAADLQSLGSFDPVELRVLYQAFDDVWSRLEPQTDPAIHSMTRNAIATALVQAAFAGEHDPEKLWCHAMQRARALTTLYWMAAEHPTKAAPHEAAPAR
jgi:hypothetical protein